MRPRCSKSAQRCRFNSVQWLPFRRGDSRCAHRPSGNRLTVLSIQPKHNASSTTSRYGMQSVRGIFVRYIVTQHSFAVAWFAMNHSRSCARLLYSNRSVISINSTFIIPLPASRSLGNSGHGCCGGGYTRLTAPCAPLHGHRHWSACSCIYRSAGRRYVWR